ncbi:MAG: ATP-binding cassette domain-containing protein [Chitinivibrionales bacterium]
MSILEIKNLHLTLGDKPILRNISMEVWEGHIHAVVGPNGAGKSTLSSVIMGRKGFAHYRGTILFQGDPIDSLSLDQRARKGITLGWQEPARFEGVSVRRYILAGASSTVEPAGILSRVGLEPDRYLDRAVDRTLSGGERKKVELGAILAMRPRLVMLDEPDSGIDIDSIDRIHDIITDLRQSGTTVLLITHSPAVLQWAEHAFLMCCGQIIQKGVTEKIIPYFRDRCIPCDHQNHPTGEEQRIDYE